MEEVLQALRLVSRLVWPQRQHSGYSVSHQPVLDGVYLLLGLLEAWSLPLQSKRGLATLSWQDVPHQLQDVPTALKQ